jgi:hypothetical protein
MNTISIYGVILDCSKQVDTKPAGRFHWPASHYVVRKAMSENFRLNVVISYMIPSGHIIYRKTLVQSSDA